MPEVTYDSLTRSLQRQIDAIKTPFGAFAKAFASLTERRIDLAPKVMKAYNGIAAEQAITFVQFVRLLDPTVPTAAVEYRVHRSYMAADYLRRLAAQRPRGQRGVRDSATDMLARSLATILQVVRDQDGVWKAVQSEFGFTERVLSGLKRRVSATKPLFALPVRPAPHIAEVIHMPRTTAPVQAEAEGEETPARGGRGRKRAA